MKALRLAAALLRVPQLFLTLVAFPLLMSLVLLWAQFMVTHQLADGGRKARRQKEQKTAAEAPAMQTAITAVNDGKLFRELLYNDPKPIAQIRICRWELHPGKGGGEEIELPPSPECYPERLDVAVQVKSVAALDPAPYARMFEGNIHRLHICQTCEPDVTIKIDDNGVVSTHLKSFYGTLVLGLSHVNPTSVVLRKHMKEDLEDRTDLIGDRFFYASEFKEGLNLDGMIDSFPVIFNIILLVLTALWLSLKAHRKVLDYFARSGALLPLVAAAGNTNFYRAIWILTFLRVGSFLLAAVPFTVYNLANIIQEQGLSVSLFEQGRPAFVMWILTLLLGLGFGTIIASVADLKHRHSVLSFAYRYVPISLSLIGGLIWTLTFLSIDGWVGRLREIISCTPILGLAPILIAPLLHTRIWVMTVHIVLTGLLLVYALRKNARWFAAHLEEI